MKILQVHNYYQYAGGEDIVVESEKKLLQDQGHTVVQYLQYNDDINLITKVRVALSSHHSRRSYLKFKKKLLEEQPDVVHVHNLFPLITPAIFDACQELNVSAVMTLHNYRLVYPNGYLYYRGGIDERTITGSAYQTVMDKVYRESMLQTLVVAHMIEYHRKKNTWNSKVAKLIALTNFAKNIFVQSGIDDSNIVVKPNFVNEPILDTNHLVSEIPNNHGYFLFVGRISEEKGIRSLVNLWMQQRLPYHLIIIGTGPLFNQLKRISQLTSNIQWLGHQGKSIVMRYMHSAIALLLPSQWYEGFPMTIVEALSLGTPVITSNIGSQAEIVRNYYSGLHFDIDNENDLLLRIEEMGQNAKLQHQLSQNGRADYLEKYTPKRNYQQLINIYKEVK